MGRFQTWRVIRENSVNAGFPEIMQKGGDTPASDEVKRTNLQPQVDAQELQTKGKKEQDRILAIDGELERIDANLPSDDEDSDKVNEFKKLWDKMKKKWDAIKMSDDKTQVEEPEDKGGLGSNMGDPNYLQTMQQHPNMVPVGPPQGPMVSYPSNT